ncbi:MAG: hypothetical protein HKN72_06995 [Gemmatimonadetes bacterium]|nr:hypothetical protein [Gemmatimonadota bacterium]
MTSQLEAMRDRLGGRRLARAGSPHVLAVLSGKGGSGVSLVSVLLAIRSARAGRRTLLVDADPWLDMQRVWLGLPKAPSAAERPEGNDDIEARVATAHQGLEVLCLGTGEARGRDHRAVVRRIPAVFRDRDAVVVDAGSRLESVERCADLDVGSILVVSGCDAVGLASTHALMKALRSRTEIQPAILFNQVDDAAARAARTVLTTGAERFLGATPTVLGSLPPDPAISDGLARGATLLECLVSSHLPDRVEEIMPSLPPWAEA